LSFASGLPTNDPYWAADEIYPRIANKDARGKTKRSPLIVAGENTGVFITAGQSLADNAVDSNTVVSNPTKVDEINLWDGGCYAASDPLVGCAGNLGNMFTQVADKLVTFGIFQRVILLPISMGGTSITNWIPGGDQHEKLFRIVRRMIAAGIPLSALSAILWQQGETDAANGMSQATYQSNFALMLAPFRALYGNKPWFLAKSTWQNGTQNTAIRAAVDAIVAGGPAIYAGANCDAFNAVPADRYDGTHPSAQGAGSMSSAWVTALDAVF
jgi:hypothetical protein